MNSISLSQKLGAEALGTGLLVATVVGSGIMAETLSRDVGLQLLCNTIPTGAILFVLITILGPLSGAHFNPVVSALFGFRRTISWSTVGLYMLAQITGGIVGAMLAHGMFALPVVEVSQKTRDGFPLLLSEAVATFGLVTVILGGLAFARSQVAGLVALYITAAYWFTASTSFANPAVTIARALTNTFSGIAPTSAPTFILAQFAGTGIAALVCGALFKNTEE
jgi:glycerol uptake facilitator-like aquaporin